MTDDITPEDEALLADLGRLPRPEPPADLAARFRERVRAAQREDGARFARRWLPVALAAGLVLTLASGWWIERRRHTDERTALRAALTTALADLSAARRLQAITRVGTEPVRDDAVIGALTQALLSDPNTNVRVAAAEALGRVASREALTDATARALASEASEFVQMALVQSSARLDLPARRQAVRPLLERNDIDPAIRREAAARARL